MCMRKSMEKKRAIISGVTGQDGSYLSELLLAKGYDVFGIVRRTSQPLQNMSLINHLIGNENFHIVSGNLGDQVSIDQSVKNIKPHEFYNLAAQSHVAVSFEVPEYTANADAIGALRILEAIKFHKLEKFTKFYLFW